MDTQFQSSDGRIVSEVIDGEAIILDVTTGNYFSADGVGAAVWGLASRGVPIESILQRVASHFGLAPSDVSADIRTFMDDLEGRGLLSRPAEPQPEAVQSDAPLAGIGPGAYAPPRLAVYEDMKDLLFIDPIHDVGEAGWPLRKEPG